MSSNIMMMLPEPTDVIPTSAPASNPIMDIPAKDFMVGGRLATSLFDSDLEQQQRGNEYQQHPDRVGDESVYTIAVHVAQMSQETNAENRSRNATHCQGQHHLAANRASSQMHVARANLGDEVEDRVRSHGNDSGHFQTENQDGEQKYAATHTGHAEQGAHYEANHDLGHYLHVQIGNSIWPTRVKTEVTPKPR